MLHVLRLFVFDLSMCLVVLSMGLFSITYVTENGAPFNELLEKYQYLFLISFIIVFIDRAYHYLKYYKLHIIPYALKLYNRVNDEKKESKIYIDKFKRYDKKTSTYYFKNRLAIDKEAYLKAKYQIIHLLGYEDNKEIEIEIKAHNKKEIAIRIFKLPRKFDWELGRGLLRNNLIYLGDSKDGAYFLPLKDLTSSIFCGESGSSKSNYLNLIILSLLHNSSNSIYNNLCGVEHLYLIDLKGVELSRYKLKNTTFTDTIEGTNDLLENLKNEMNHRFQEMKEKGDLIYDGKYKICLIDEIGTISTHHDKKLKEQIHNSLIEIAQKGRASKVLLLIFSQKIDAKNIDTNVLTNLQGSFLLRTSSQFNINNSIGLQEEIEEITRTRVQDFPKGRVIFKNGLSSEKILLQTPFLSQDTQESMIKYFRSWINK